MRILLFSTLFPNAVEPRHGIFVETRLRHLRARHAIGAHVIAPVPWFPLRGRGFGAYGRFAEIPRRALRHGVAIDHPRYPLIPKVGMGVAPGLMAQALAPFVRRRLHALGGVDLIDAHYVYPDGVAAVQLAKRFGLPVTLTARGTDLNLIARFPGPRRQIVEAIRQADGLIAVCQALADVYLELGADPAKLRVLRNGVDLELFRPQPRHDARTRFGMTGPSLLSVGHLIERKGHDLVIKALADLSDLHLFIAGDGPEQPALERLAARLGVSARVRFLGALSQQELAALYSAGDALVLASSREGWANVLLEAMACGTPVVASPVWGTPEVVAAQQAGRLMAERSVPALIDAVRKLLAKPPARADTRAFAERFDWHSTSDGQMALFREILARRGSVRAA